MRVVAEWFAQVTGGHIPPDGALHLGHCHGQSEGTMVGLPRFVRRAARRRAPDIVA